MKCKCGCGKNITPKPWHLYYSHDFLKGHRISVKLKSMQCCFCHKEIKKRVPKCLLHLKHRFCSRQCCANFKKQKNIKKCFTCNNQFHRRGKRLTKTGKTFCSNKCARRYFSKEKHPFWKLKISKHCKICNKEMALPPWAKDRILCSTACYAQWVSLNYKGPKAGNWQGGVTPETNLRCSSKKWKDIRNAIFRRDGFVCQKCGLHGANIEPFPLAVHHIIPYRISKNNAFDNLVTLCKKCHSKEEWLIPGFQKRQKLPMQSNQTE